MTGEEKIRLYLEHPDESPEIVGTLPYLIHPPTKLATIAADRHIWNADMLHGN